VLDEGRLYRRIKKKEMDKNQRDKEKEKEKEENMKSGCVCLSDVVWIKRSYYE
jgi:hypothetical protein